MGIVVGGKNELIISGSNCDQLLKQERALCVWKKKVEPEFIIPAELSQKCLPDKKGLIKLVISTCLPEFAKNYQNKKLINDGPNCWGTAMSFNKLDPKPRFIWPEEMMYWINNSPLCKKLSAGEEKLPGDIINVYAPEKMDELERIEKDAGTKFWDSLYPNRYTAVVPDPSGSNYTGFHRLLHSVTYISDSLAFGKDSPAKDDHFYFHPMNEVYGRPGLESKECQENQSLIPYIREYQKAPQKIRGSKCSYFSLVYRCENFADYFSKLKLKESDTAIWKNVQSLQGIQEKLFPLLTSHNKILEDSEVTHMLALADMTAKNAAAELQKTKLEKNREMLLTMQYFAAAGIRQTLEQFELVKPIN
ncbi:MAG: hypothetical protein H7336_02035 [Bacteriovorax sp.]|nr:hypothetical protein [Bacteriovorax sp.]